MNGLQVPGNPWKQRAFGHFMLWQKCFCNTFATRNVKSAKWNGCRWLTSKGKKTHQQFLDEILLINPDTDLLVTYSLQ